MKLKDPYWFKPFNEMHWRDFTKEIIEPGGDHLPDGAVGVRTDDDFWVNAFLPYEEFKDQSIEDIVYTLWPELKGEPNRPRFLPDSGSDEQAEMYKRQEAELVERRTKDV